MPDAPPLARPTDHPLARSLWPHLVADAHEQLRFALKVALLADAGLDRTEITDRLGASPKEMAAAWAQLERVGARPQRGTR